jgi:hypothetical protein
MFVEIDNSLEAAQLLDLPLNLQLHVGEYFGAET